MLDPLLAEVALDVRPLLAAPLLHHFGVIEDRRLH
jgi:hypothetical protein